MAIKTEKLDKFSLPISILNGGTGNTSFQDGALIYYDAGATQLKGNSSYMKWDYSNNRLGIRKTTPARTLDIASPDYIPARFSGSTENLAGANVFDLYARTGGTIYTNTEVIGSEMLNYSQLAIFEIPANTLNAVGECLELFAYVQIAGNINTKKLKITVGGITLFENANILTISNPVYASLHATFILTSVQPANLRCSVEMLTQLDGGVTVLLPDVFLADLNVDNTVRFDIGIYGGDTNANDVIHYQSRLMWWSG